MPGSRSTGRTGAVSYTHLDVYKRQDEGNGINVFPIDDNTIRRGDQVMVTGSISEYIDVYKRQGHRPDYDRR